MTEGHFLQSRLVFALMAAMGPFAVVTSAEGFCVRNDTGASIVIEAKDGSANFSHELINNKKVCCEPKDEACAIGAEKVKLSISSEDGEATCQVTVSAKGNVNVTGKPDEIKCKANKGWLHDGLGVRLSPQRSRLTFPTDHR